MNEQVTAPDPRLGAYHPANRQDATDDLIRMLTESADIPGNVRLPREAVNMLLAELRKATRAAQTLGQVIDKQCLDVLEVTGLHHLINGDGDGHWDVVWMRLFEMRDELISLKESTIGRERLRGDAWRDRAQEMEVSRDNALAELRKAQDKLARVEGLAEKWRYKGEYGYGAWQEGYGPDHEGYLLDNVSGELRAAVADATGGGDQ